MRTIITALFLILFSQSAGAEEHLATKFGTVPVPVDSHEECLNAFMRGEIRRTFYDGGGSRELFIYKDTIYIFTQSVSSSRNQSRGVYFECYKISADEGEWYERHKEPGYRWRPTDKDWQPFD